MKEVFVIVRKGYSNIFCTDRVFINFSEANIWRKTHCNPAQTEIKALIVESQLQTLADKLNKAKLEALASL